MARHIEKSFDLPAGWLDGTQIQDLLDIDESTLTPDQTWLIRAVSAMGDDDILTADRVIEFVSKKASKSGHTSNVEFIRSYCYDHDCKCKRA